MGCKGSTISDRDVYQLRPGGPATQDSSTKTGIDVCAQVNYVKRVWPSRRREEDDLVYELDQPEYQDYAKLKLVKHHPSHPVVKFKQSFGSGRAVSQKASPVRRQSDFVHSRFSTKEVVLPKSKFGSPPTNSIAGEEPRSSIRQVLLRKDAPNLNSSKPEQDTLGQRQSSYDLKKVMESRKRLLEQNRPSPIRNTKEMQIPDKLSSVIASKIDGDGLAESGFRRTYQSYGIKPSSDSKIKLLNGSVFSLMKVRSAFRLKRRNSLDGSAHESSIAAKEKEFRVLKEARLNRQNTSGLIKSHKNEVSRDSPDFSIIRGDDLRKRVLKSAQDQLAGLIKSTHQYNTGKPGQKRVGQSNLKQKYLANATSPIKKSTESLPESQEESSRKKLGELASTQAKEPTKVGTLPANTGVNQKQKVVMMFPIVIKKQKKKKVAVQEEPKPDLGAARLVQVLQGEGTSPKQYSQTTKTTEVFKHSGSRFGQWIHPDVNQEHTYTHGGEQHLFDSSPKSGAHLVRFSIAINGQLDCWKDIPILKKDSELVSRIDSEAARQGMDPLKRTQGLGPQGAHNSGDVYQDSSLNT